MSPTELPGINSDEFSRCEERGQITNLGKSLSKTQQIDAVIKDAIYHAFWKDNVLRAIEYYELDVHVKNETVYLYGHIVSTGSQLRIMNAIQTVPNILEIKNHLVLDDKLTQEVATSLGKLEHTYGCKFFTGASHGDFLPSNVASQTLLARPSQLSMPKSREIPAPRTSVIPP